MSKAKCSGRGQVATAVLSMSSAAKGAKISEALHALERDPVVSQEHRAKFPDLMKGDVNLLFSKNALSSPSPLPLPPCH